MPKPATRPPAPLPRRLKAADRERLIIAEATRYFSERGLAGGTDELAKRLGITQPLLFRYFPTKMAMIERIFREIETTAFDPDWVRQIEDRSVPLEERLAAFYVAYFTRVMTRENFRLFLHGGLMWSDRPSTRNYGRMRRVIYPALARALAAEFRPGAKGRVTPFEMEMVQTLHATMHHMAVRRWVFGPPLRGRIRDLIRFKVAIFLRGARAVASRG